MKSNQRTSQKDSGHQIMRTHFLKQSSGQLLCYSVVKPSGTIPGKPSMSESRDSKARRVSHFPIISNRLS